MTRRFQRTIENFTCEHCGVDVQGNGYRNHCPSCLTSKHVDVFPGDRLAACRGLMDVVDVILEHGDIMLMHACRLCAYQKRNRIAPDDSIERVILLMRTRHEKEQL